ncbi:uncharacterized protein LOC122531752 isoform X2 [Frieseomelitta varia]|uniref:uncharacterized protein LOC122531752 isoform X2 n=1 Tax=Frieseomelitta varia TaxID=561572 RepID=UPI001CB68DD4|nr:uncharacterized protein LOC122531752 isoform X2 [Frieseomelitta varia]
MYHCYLKLLQQKVSHYISWNILFLWGFGLWIALCTSNVYHSIIAKQQDFEVLHDISTEAKTIEEMLDVTRTNHTFCNVIIMLKTVLQYIYGFVSVSFVMFFARSYGSFRKVIKICNNTICNFYFTTFAKRKKSIYNKSDSNRKDSAMLEYKLIPNSTTSTKYVQTELSCNDEDKWDLMMNRNKNTLDMNVIQSEIIFTSRTLLLFNNCELYRYFNNHRLKNHLLTKYFARQDPVHVENNLEISNEYERNDRILPKKVIKRGIISSSPEFKKFLANLTKSELFYPCMLEVSASYMIRIKSTCKSSRSND